MNILQTIAERRISEALETGAFPDLSHWKNRPLPDDETEMRMVAPDLRMAYKVLKNSGYIPEELALHQEIRRTQDLLAHATEEREKLCHLRRISLLCAKLEASTGRPVHLGEGGPYFARVSERLARK